MDAVVPSGNVDADSGTLLATVYGSHSSGNIAKHMDWVRGHVYSSFLKKGPDWGMQITKPCKEVSESSFSWLKIS